MNFENMIKIAMWGKLYIFCDKIFPLADLRKEQAKFPNQGGETFMNLLKIEVITFVCFVSINQLHRPLFFLFPQYSVPITASRLFSD